MKLNPVDFNTLNPEIFKVFDVQNALLTAGNQKTCNTMTIGWCQLGTLWSLPVCTVYVRPERYTYRFMENYDYFTVSVMPITERNTVAVCGTKSGREIDKIKECGLTVRYGKEEAPFFDEAEMVLVCKKIYVQDMELRCVKEGDKILPFYGKMGGGGWHRAYIGQVVEAYAK